jgi:arsenical pump membrane protein
LPAVGIFNQQSMPALAAHWHSVITWLVSLLAIGLVLIRPKGWPEAIWAGSGACLLVATGLISPARAASAAAKGTDVYLFLTGMMIVSELARRAGVFDWVAQRAVRACNGAPSRLFVMIYLVGTIVTVFLSNDATAVVLTPAVLAAVRAAEADPLPYLLICAFIANAASFVLPISNPANLVVYQGAMPPLAKWIATFGLPSVASIAITFLVLRRVADRYLRKRVKTGLQQSELRVEGKITLFGIAFLAIVLLVASAFNVDLGAPACAAGVVVAIAVCLRDRNTWKAIVAGVAWSVLPLVAGLFVIVEALNRVGALQEGTDALHALSGWPPALGALASGFGVALISNVMNNLPSGLITAAAVNSAHVIGKLRDSVLVGVDLGPNLSVTGSLATILWLIAIRREGLTVTFWDFLKWGAVVMPPALLASLLLTDLWH